MGVALIVDWVDGSLVRYFDLDPKLSNYDGVKLDEYADLVVYVIAPVVLAWASGQLPLSPLGYSVGVIVCVVSCLQFSKQTTKTDRAFWGWPCYWNFVYFYGWGLGIGPGVAIPLTLACAVATFFPVPFPYPSRLPIQTGVLTALGTVWGIIALGFLLVPGFPKLIFAASLIFPLYYLALPLFYYEQLK